MTIAVGMGLMDFPFSSANAYWKWVKMCEEGNIDSLWQTDRLVSEVPFLETMVAMASIAGATKKIKFGMNVLSVGLRDPLLLAKQCATVDMLSNGRLLPGFGIGNAKAAEWSATNRPTKGRGNRTNEALQIIKLLWEESCVNFEGEYFQYRNARISPKPVQRNIPMWIGGSSEAAVRRTARFGTGWQGGLETPEETAPIVRSIKGALKEEGRKIDDDHYGAFFSYHLGSYNNPSVKEAFSFFENKLTTNPERRIIVGSSDDVINHIHDFIDSGISKIVLRPIGNDDDEIFEQTERIISQVLPEVEKLNQKP